MSFCGKWAWSPLDSATPLNFLAAKSWVSELSFEVLFVSALAMVLSEYWKRLAEEILWNYIISAIWSKCRNLQKKNPPAFFNILKEPLLVQKQTIPQKKGLILSFLEQEILRARHYQEGVTPTYRKKHILLTFYMGAEGFWLFVFYDIARTLFMGRWRNTSSIRCLMVSTDQADSRCFYFRISWILMEWRWFYFFCPLHLVQGLRSNNIK